LRASPNWRILLRHFSREIGQRLIDGDGLEEKILQIKTEKIE
jgi:hypothetical protein